MLMSKSRIWLNEKDRKIERKKDRKKERKKKDIDNDVISDYLLLSDLLQHMCFITV